ncbi:pyridoxamine 5'-phosphate oxidase family protein [Candidatus Saccharibacteria bacterium]|nr:pyridoxamine 5'-phosphate oxidase family protein [Candidatus Saccharibacteria bacterium]
MIFEDILNRRALGVLATIDENKPRTRVLQALWTEGNKIFFSTGAQKPTFQQMEKNPQVSFCVENKYSPVISFNGEMKVVDDSEYKERAFKMLPPIVRKIYDEKASHPLFKVFYIDVKQIRSFSYKEGLKEYIIEENGNEKLQ